MRTEQTDALRTRLYDVYTSTNAGPGSAAASRHVYRRDIRLWLPLGSCLRVLDIGCGQGELVALMVADGLDAHGVDASPEQVQAARANGISRVELGDFHSRLRSEGGALDAVVATDVLEHLRRDELIVTFDDVLNALRPGGVFVARVPNAGSPTGGAIMYGDLTYETWFTQRWVAQLTFVAGSSVVRTLPCPPVAHGVLSAARSVVWRFVNGLQKLALAAETGQLRGHTVTQNLTFVAAKAQ